MPSKRQKISHESSSALDSKAGPSQVVREPSPPSSESATVDGTPGQEPSEGAQKTFKDLVSSCLGTISSHSQLVRY